MAAWYQVVGQRQNVEINPTSSGFRDVWEVSYKVTDGPSKGVVGTVTVPDEEHNADYVDKAIKAKILDLHAIASLGTDAL